jgi:hypothetical protein
MNINLFTGWFYEPRLLVREEEFDFCYQKNKELKFNNIIVNTTKQPTFNGYFEEMKNYPNDINIIANPDNFFDSQFLDKLNNLYSNYKNKEKLCLGLTRWNYVNEDNIRFFNTSGSQDVFIFYGSIDFEERQIIPIGVPGGDNRLVAILMYEFKMDIYNPSKDLKYYHYHPSDDATRTYLDENLRRKVWVSGPHEFLEPCCLNDIKNN